MPSRDPKKNETTTDPLSKIIQIYCRVLESTGDVDECDLKPNRDE